MHFFGEQTLPLYTLRVCVCVLKKWLRPWLRCKNWLLVFVRSCEISVTSCNTINHFCLKQAEKDRYIKYLYISTVYTPYICMCIKELSSHPPSFFFCFEVAFLFSRPFLVFSLTRDLTLTFFLALIFIYFLFSSSFPSLNSVSFAAFVFMLSVLPFFFFIFLSHHPD